MKDYSFGNYICALRRGIGLSQFQLGALVGVSDKAVSKWENGDAKPKFATCFRLADVLGVPIDELLSCKQPSVTLARKDLDRMKQDLWKQAYNRLSIFGDTPPVVCWSRLAAEEAVLCETDAIQSFAVMSKIQEAAKMNNSVVFAVNTVSSSFAAWLLGATNVNPLPPHYRCPSCGKTEFIYDIKDGFDLPIRRCECGAEFLRDGHNIPFEGYAKAEQHRTSVDFRVSRKFKPIVVEIIKAHYEGKAEIMPVRLATGSRVDCIEKYVVMVPNKSKPPLSEDGVWYVDPEEFYRWWDKETIYSLHDVPDIERIQNFQERTNTKIPDVMSLFTPEIAERLYIKKRKKSEHITAMTDLLDINEPHDFCLLLQIEGFCHSAGAWFLRNWQGEFLFTNGEGLVREGKASFRDIPALREDVWNDISEALARKGIRNNGLALQVMEDVRLGRYYNKGMPAELEKMLFSLDLPEWYPEYLKKVMHMFPKGHCVNLLLTEAIYEWYRMNYPDLDDIISENGGTNDG